MTSLKSLKYKNVSPFAFRNSFRSGILPFLAYFAFMAFICPILNFFNLQDEYTAIQLHEFYEDITHLNQRYIYSIMAETEDASIFITIATLVAAALMGISMFRFITSKKTVNVYYSLGIKRTNLFLARYCAGLVMLFAAIAVPVAASCLINIGFIGYSAEMLRSAVYITLSVFSLAALTFSVTSAVMSSVGTSIEGLGFTTIIMLIPTGFIYMIELLTQNLLYGNPFKSGYYLYKNSDLSLVFKYGKFNPIMYLYSILEDDTIGRLRLVDLSTFETTKASVTDFMHPEVAIIWLIVGFATAGLGVYLFNKRKAEICGFFGTNKALNFMTAFVAGVGVFTISTSVIYEEFKAASIIVSLIGIALTYLVINLIFTRSFKKTFRSIYLLGAEYIAVIIIFTIFATGGFGYSSRMPKLTEVKSAYISTVAYETVLTDDDCCVWSHYSDVYSAFTDVLSDSALGPYTSPDDVLKIQQLHSKLIQLSAADKNSLYNTNIIIHYKLADGSDFCRYYEYADLEALRMNLKLYETDFFKNELEESYLKDEYSHSDMESDMYSLNMVYDETKIIAVGSSLKSEDFKYMDLSEEQFDGLKKAIVDDLKSLSSDQYYTPESPAIGAIVFRNTQSLYDYSDDKSNIIIHESMLASNVFNSEESYMESTVFLTPDMAETLSFLENNGLMSYFKTVSADDVIAISFLPAVIDRNNVHYMLGTEFTLDFYAVNETNSLHYENIGEGKDYEIANQNFITDKDQIAEILKNTHLKYYTGNSGYICRITYQNGEIVRKYISSEDAPDYVKNYEYYIGYDETYSSVYKDIAIIGGADGPVEIAVAEIQ